MNFWEVMKSLGIFGGIGAFMFFLARSLFTHILSKDTERFKTNLQLESRREIESFKSNLAQTGYEHQVRFSRLHEKRASVIEETYANIVNLYYASARFLRMFPVSGKEPDDQNVSNLLEAMSSFVTHFERHRIYFDSEVSEKIVRLNEGLSKAINMPLAFSTKQLLTPDRKVEMQEWSRAWDVMQKEIPPIKADLEDTFRELLGVIEPKKGIGA